jgi:Family of unknown function (DUF5681)
MPREDTQFKPGKSGNPSGRAKGYAEFSEAARKVCLEGIAAVYRIARSHPDPSIQLAAWKLLFERGYGKALAPVAVNLEADVQHSFVVVAPPPALSSAAWEAAHSKQLQIEDQGYDLQEQVNNGKRNLSRVADERDEQHGPEQPAVGMSGSAYGPHPNAGKRLKPGRRQGATLTPQVAKPDPLATEFDVVPARPGSLEDFVSREGRRRFAHHRCRVEGARQ